jgi:putative secretion ATPase (PEP-CTERM system associated)
MYKTFYGFSEKPFSIASNPAFLYLSEGHENALTYLEYGITENSGFILLTGEVGAGKTTLVRHMLNRVASEMEIAEIFNTNVSPDQLLSLILAEFGLSPANGDKSKNLDMLQQYLIDRYAIKKPVLLVIDEAQNLSNEAMEEIRMFSNLHADERLLLQILLVGQSELQQRLKTSGLRQFAQRISVSYHLSELKRDETEKYIVHRLKKAGGSPDIFTQAAMDRIHDASGGIPRTINLLCDAALVYGYADELKCIETSLIETIVKEKNGIGIAVPRQSQSAPVSAAAGNGMSHVILKRLTDLETTVVRLESQLAFFFQELKKPEKGHGFDIDVNRTAKVLNDSGGVKRCDRNQQMVKAALCLVCFWSDHELGMTAVDVSRRFGISVSTARQASLLGEKIAKKLKADSSGSRSLSETWYKDLIYEIEQLAEEEEKNIEKYLYGNNKEMITQTYNVYAKLTEKIKVLRRDLE